MSVPNEESSLIYLDFNQARARHLLFKNNLRSILYGGEVDHAPILSEHECSVGKWIYEHGLERYGHIPEMLQLEKEHTNIHQVARDLVKKYNAGFTKEARAGLSAMDAIADKLVVLLDNIESQMMNEKVLLNSPPVNGDELTGHELELTNLYKIIKALDVRIREQTQQTNSARRVAEASEQNFRNAVMQAPVGIIILRGWDMVVEMANENYLALVDRKKEELVGRSLYEAMPEVKIAVAPLLEGILTTGEPYFGYEFEVSLNRFGKKEQSFFNFVYSPLRDADENISGIIVVATEVTVQVKSRIALEQKDAQFRKLVSNSPIAMAILQGPDFVVELANTALLQKIWRKKWEEVKGRKLLEIFPELASQKFPELLSKVYTTGSIHHEPEAMATIVSADGAKIFYLDFEYSPLLDIDGAVSGIIATVNDVTGAVTARKKLEDAERRYRELIEVLPVAFFTVDANGFLDLYNQEAVNLWQRTPKKGVDKWCGSHGLLSLDKVIVPHDECPISVALRENRSMITEAYVQRPDGELRHVIAHPQPIRDDKGVAIGAMNVLVDITDRKDAELALSTSEEKFRLLADFMPQIIWTADAAGELNYFSQSVFDYSGFTEERIFREGWLEIVHPDDRKENLALWQEAVRTGRNFHYEHRFRRADGEYRWQLSRAIPQRDADGNIKMWVGTSTDIHDRRLFQDELAERVEERTRELTITNQQLVKSNAELAQFAYVASHDLQEPLRKIQTFISRILDLDYEALSPKSKDYFARISKSSNRTQQLIQDLLSFSRARAVERVFTPTDLNELLHQVREEILETHRQGQVTITSDALPTLPVIDFQFQQLFTNLLTNAIKFSRPDTPCVVHLSADIVTAEEVRGVEVPRGRYHHISCSDNGIGFDPQFNERIFLVFQRLHAREKYEGTGIGLAICQKIVENHHGYISAEGIPGEGATFHIYLPVK